MTVAYEDQKQRAIAVALGVKAATELATATDDPFGMFDHFVEATVATVVNLHVQHAIQDAFPGTTVIGNPAGSPVGYVPSPAVEITQGAQQAPLVPAQAPIFVPGVPQPQPSPYGPQQQYYAPAQPAPQPASVPGSTDGDPVVASWWSSFFQDPSAWHDNRVGKRSPQGPDFRSKTIPDPKDAKYKAALWIQDKKNPSWVLAALQQRGLA